VKPDGKVTTPVIVNATLIESVVRSSIVDAPGRGDVSVMTRVRGLRTSTLAVAGYGRILMHPGTGFTLSLMKHDGAHGGPFTELTTGLDHLGLTAASRADLEEWERRFDELGVTYTPIRDMEFGFHLNFRDPDNMALELSAPNEHLVAAKKALADGQTSQADIDAFIDEHELDLPQAGKG
jgi:hypothetical protein